MIDLIINIKNLNVYLSVIININYLFINIINTKLFLIIIIKDNNKIYYFNYLFINKFSN